jgi:hypothetical protein
MSLYYWFANLSSRRLRKNGKVEMHRWAQHDDFGGFQRVILSSSKDIGVMQRQSQVFNLLTKKTCCQGKNDLKAQARTLSCFRCMLLNI